MRVGTASDVATLLKLRKETVYRMAQTGELPSLRRLGPRLRFDLDAIEAWMQRGQS